MNKENDGSNSILSAIVSSAFFLIAVILLKWNFFVSAGLAVLLFLAISLLTTPVKKLGGIAVENIDQGARLSKIYDQAEGDIKEMAVYQKAIKAPDVAEKAWLLNNKGTNILKYLSNNPKSISTSEHFLKYYLGTANRILDNFVEMQDSNVSEGKATLIHSETVDSLDYLQEIFTKQLDSYYDEKILQLEVESDLLEKTVKLGGGRK